jgi:hypothetical protein
LLKLREFARNCIKFEVGDGSNIHMWYDQWHPSGVLIEKYGPRIVYDASSRLDAKLISVLNNRNWCWKPARSEALVEIQCRLPEVSLGLVDKPVWHIARKGSYVCSNTWEFLRGKKHDVLWWHLIWFPLAIPKQAFILWLAVQNRLTTGDRLLVWGFQGDINCVFCRHGVESRDHLFFDCSFSFRIWRTCMQRCPFIATHTDWQSLLDDGCKHWKKKTLAGILCRLVFSSAVYNIWRARNEIKFHGHPKSEEQILKLIFWEVHIRMSGSSKFKKTRENIRICQIWNLACSVLY